MATTTDTPVLNQVLGVHKAVLGVRPPRNESDAV